MPGDLVPIAEGARRLGLAHDSVRKRLSAGTLRGEKRHGRWFVCGNAYQGGARCEGGACECASGEEPCGEQCCNALLGETCTTNFGNPICCVPASVCGGSCCTGGCCVNARQETCGTPCGARCCPDGKSCVTRVHGGKTQYACR